MDQAQDRINRQRRPTEGPKESRAGKNSLEAARPADGLDVLKNDADDFAEAEGDDGEVISLEAQRRHAHQEARDAGADAAGDQCEQKQQGNAASGLRFPEPRQHVRPQKRGDRGGGISAHRHEPGMAQGELAGIAVDQIQTDGQDDIDPDAKQHIQVIGVEGTGSARYEEGGDESEQEKDFRLHQTFSASLVPSNPEGLKSRIKIRMAKAIASR